MPVTQPDLHRVPVHLDATESAATPPKPGIGLCLSGGGYRAMLFHLGALWRLNESGLLPKINRISSVSGGSIIAATLGLAWRNLAFEQGVATRFEIEVVQPLRRLAGFTVDVRAFLYSGLGFCNVGKRVASYYNRFLFHGATLQDLADDAPEFVINATNVQSGVLWRFSKAYMSDYRVGSVRKPTISLALAVAASSACPPVLSPFTLKLKPTDFLPPDLFCDLHREPFTTKIILTDGGVYDNLGLETVWKSHDTVLVSDGGLKPRAQAKPSCFRLMHTLRVINLVDNQVRSLRKRQLIESYNTTDSRHREGTYWGIESDMKKYANEGNLNCPEDRTRDLVAIGTRLCALDDGLQERVINWGYAICDAALRKHCQPVLQQYCGRMLLPPNGFPYPQVGV